MSRPPRSAADPRPGGKPYYIDPNCPECGTALVLADQAEPVWHDEWVCPNHVDLGIHMDWPPGEFQARHIPLKDVLAEALQDPETRAEWERTRPALERSIKKLQRKRDQGK